MQYLKKHTVADAPLEEKKLSLTEELSALEVKIKQARKVQAEFYITQDDLVLKRGELANVDTLLSDKHSELEKLSDKILEAHKTERQLLGSIEKLDSNAVEISEKTVQKEKERLILLQDTEKLERQKTELKNIVCDIPVQTEKLKEVLGLITLAENKMVATAGAVERLAKEVETLEAQKTNLNKYIDEKSTLLEIREGDASRKESWLANKEEKLRLLKTELEEYYNRKFPHIII